MSSKHYGWQARWAVDVDARTATHDSGLAVDFDAVPMAHDAQLAPLTGYCTGTTGQRYLGRLRGGEDGARAFLATQPALRDPASQANRLRRLMREAGEIFTEYLNGRTGRTRRTSAD